MTKVLVCQHVAYEILGTLNPLLKEHGFRIRYVNFDRHPQSHPQLEGYDALVILGGPMNLDQRHEYRHLSHEIDMIGTALEQDIPVLGICLGAQLIAAALGATIRRNPVKEIGWYDLCLTEPGKRDPVLAPLKECQKIFQWHGDTFEIPKDAVHLAKTTDCPHQAFRYGDKVYAFQFHPEVDEAMIHRWLKVPRHVREMAALNGQIDPEQIRTDTSLHIAKMTQVSTRIFGAFIKLIGAPHKARQLPSR